MKLKIYTLWVAVCCDRVCIKCKYCRATYADCCVTESFCSATKIVSHTVKQLLHQYNKKLALCYIEGELLSSFPFNIERSHAASIL